MSKSNLCQTWPYFDVHNMFMPSKLRFFKLFKDLRYSAGGGWKRNKLVLWEKRNRLCIAVFALRESKIVILVETFSKLL